MNKWNVSTRIFVLAIVPTILIALLLSIFFVNSYSKTSNLSLSQRAYSVTANLAASSEFDIVSQNFINLQKSAQQAMQADSDIELIVIYDSNSRIITSVGSTAILDNLPIFEPGNFNSESINQQGNINVVSQEFYQGYLYSTTISSNFIEPHEQWKPKGTNLIESDQILGYLVVYFSQAAILSSQIKVLIGSLAIIFLGLLLSIKLAQKTSSSVIQPIENMTSGVNRIKEGFLNTRISTDTSSELKRLEQGINTMAQRLEHNQEELKAAVKQATTDLQDTLETLEVNNLELDLARKQALEASRIKTEFLANMGHEIRTPMNGVIGFTDLLLKTQLNNKQKDFLLDIKRSAGNLLSIIDDILDYSKIEAGKMSLERYPFDLRECVDDVFSMLGPKANKKGLELISLIYSDVPSSLLGDPIRIKQIITNLIGNAIKFTQSGCIELHAEIESELEQELTLKIQVKDTGIGMSVEQQNSLFKAFNQADASTKRIFGGTGLGLVISKSLVEKMGGEINVESTADAGSNFWFTLKCMASESSQEKEIGSQILAHNSALVFDPHSSVRLSMIQMLEDLNMSVTSFETIEDLITEVELCKANQKSIEIIIVGGQAFKRRKAQLEHLCSQASEISCPVITFSTSAEPSALDQLQQLGVSRTLRKPLTHRNLYNVLLETLRDKDLASVDSHENLDLSVLSNLYVLAVDDNPANLRLVDILLTDLGVNVDIAEDGMQAISLSKDKVYDLILMDIQMPEIDGIEASRTIKANNTNAKTPIVALTAHSMANEKEQLIEAGMADYMTKPVSESDLVKILLKWTHSINLDTNLEEEKSQNLETTLDWKLSLKLANNNGKLATDMLKMLVESNFETSKTIHAAFQAQEFENLLHQVHKLHGASCYLGTPKLKRISSNYETKLKKQQFNSIENIHNELLLELEKINQEAVPYITDKVINNG